MNRKRKSSSISATKNRSVRHKTQLPIGLACIVARKCGFALLQKNDANICRWLIHHELISDPESLLVWASKKNKNILVAMLLHHHKMQRTLIKLAASESSDADILGSLLRCIQSQSGLDHHEWLTIWQRSYNVYQHSAEYNNEIKSIRDLLVDIRPISEPDSISTALYYSVTRGDVQATQSLLDVGAIPWSNLCDCAVIRNLPDIVELLLRYGLTPPYDYTFLDACGQGLTQTVKWLIKYLPDIRWSLDEGLSKASHSGQLETVKALLDAGAVLGANDRTACALALAGEHIDIYELLNATRLPHG